MIGRILTINANNFSWACETDLSPELFVFSMFSMNRLWETMSGRQASCLSGHTSTIYSLSLSMDGKLLATGSVRGLGQVLLLV